MNPTAGLLLLNYSYGTTANNGNVVSQQIQVGDSLDQTQTYTYDKLNRLKTATETGAGRAGRRPTSLRPLRQPGGDGGPTPTCP